MESGMPVGWSQASPGEVPIQVACQHKLGPLGDALPLKLLLGDARKQLCSLLGG